MTGLLSREELVRAMVAQGVPIVKAEQFAEQREAAQRGFVQVDPELAATSSNHVRVVAMPAPLPIRFVLPWSALCSDNTRERASLIMMGTTPVPRKVMDARYKQAREKVIGIANGVMNGYAVLDMPLSLVGRVWIPSNSQRVDVCNFAKGVHDALQKVVYQNDAQLEDTRWLNMGTDVDAPRAEIEIRPL